MILTGQDVHLLAAGFCLGLGISTALEPGPSLVRGLIALIALAGAGLNFYLALAT